MNPYNFVLERLKISRKFNHVHAIKAVLIGPRNCTVQQSFVLCTARHGCCLHILLHTTSGCSCDKEVSIKILSNEWNWVFGTKPDFLILISLDLRYFNLWNHNLSLKYQRYRG